MSFLIARREADPPEFTYEFLNMALVLEIYL
jgi:hypothetical protein